MAKLRVVECMGPLSDSAWAELEELENDGILVISKHIRQRFNRPKKRVRRKTPKMPADAALRILTGLTGSMDSSFESDKTV